MPSKRYSPSIVGSGLYTRIRTASTLVTISRAATESARMPARRRRFVRPGTVRAIALDRDEDGEHRPAVDLRARGVRQLRDPSADRGEKLVLHLHRLERDDRRVLLH